MKKGDPQIDYRDWVLSEVCIPFGSGVFGSNVCSKKIEWGKHLLYLRDYLREEWIYLKLLLGLKGKSRASYWRSLYTVPGIENPDKWDISQNDYPLDSEADLMYGYIF